jgi:hypothetical protein
MMSIDLVLVLYAKKRLTSTVGIVKRLTRVINLRRIIIVINGEQINPRYANSVFSYYCENCTVIQHDNTGLEFGAYQAGVNCLNNDSLERIILMNDTVGSHQYYSMIHLGQFCRAISVSGDRISNFVTGHVDVHERHIDINGSFGIRWVRSNLVGLDKEAVAKLGGKIYDPSIDNLISESDDLDTFFGPSLDGSVKLKIADWLFSTSPGKWYNAQPLSAVNSAMMAGKARSFLQEQYLSMRLEAVGAAFFVPRITFIEQCIHKGLEIMGI